MIRQTLLSAITANLMMVPGLSATDTPSRFDNAVESARMLGAMRLDGELFHVQGLALDGARIWVTSVDRRARRAYLHEFDRVTGKALRRLDVTDAARYHPGGISMDGRSIWLPVAEMRANSSAVILEIDADTLAVRRRIRVADHVGCVAVKDGRLVAGNWNSRKLYLLDLADIRRAGVVRNPSPTRYQDMKFAGGALVAGGYRTLWSGTVDWIDPATMTVRRSLRAGALNPVRPFGRGGPFTGEGMTIEGRDLYLVPEDGPSRLFHFRLDA